MAGKYPDKIKSLPLYDGRFDAYKLEAEGSADFEVETDEIEFWFEP